MPAIKNEIGHIKKEIAPIPPPNGPYGNKRPITARAKVIKPSKANNIIKKPLIAFI